MELSEIEFDPRTKILCIKFANTLHLTKKKKKKSMFRTDSRMDIFVRGSTCHYEVVSVLALKATVNRGRMTGEFQTANLSLKDLRSPKIAIFLIGQFFVS